MIRNYRTVRVSVICLTSLLLLAGCRRDSYSISTSPVLASLSQPIRVSAKDMDSAEPAIAVAPEGEVYVVWVNHGTKSQADVMISRFTSAGQPSGEPVRVNSKPGVATAWRGDPPTVAVAPDQTVYVGWTARVDSESGHATDLYLSSSKDHAQTFGLPVRVNDDKKPAVHGMHSMTIGSNGYVYMAWLDERNIAPVEMKAMKMVPSAKDHHMESNRELFNAYSTDGGQSFSHNQLVARDVCPCCKTALAIAPDGRIYLAWRQVLPGDFRHIAVSNSTDGGKSFSKPVVVSNDQWVIKGCPVSGPSLLADNTGRLRVLWYAGADNSEQGIYWSESLDGGQSFSSRQLLSSGFARSNPILLSDGSSLPIAVWEMRGDSGSEIHAASLSTNHQQLTVTRGELPAATSQNGHTYIVSLEVDSEKRSVWLQQIKRA